MTAHRLRIYGKVQGVFYRNWAEQTARSLGLSGWVRNCMDGSVEAVISGETEHVRRFIVLAHKGPAAARVTHIDECAEPDAAYIGFVVQPTQ